MAASAVAVASAATAITAPREAHGRERLLRRPSAAATDGCRGRAPWRHHRGRR
ncbi:short-chain dehydrogenase [Burkholderia pseudomallei]|nr:short-chain dehydrogenase [Burkholderia pseudomallei]EQA89311.1 short-chain dehydrogenase [Burkholderia pseudomallei MSHR338]KIX46756.1 short-chain dehydrogenase [Burkholderia pseudomallei]OMO13852.1 short-chain dehydrogenase [Burkholderia pseudomallei]OMS88205.1 short-chain dehydrogenase [Burkholderia pseudomallei]